MKLFTSFHDTTSSSVDSVLWCLCESHDCQVLPWPKIIQSCDIDFSWHIDETQVRDVRILQVASMTNRSRCRMILHDRTVYLHLMNISAVNNFPGKGSTRVTNSTPTHYKPTNLSTSSLLNWHSISRNKHTYQRTDEEWPVSLWHLLWKQETLAEPAKPWRPSHPGNQQTQNQLNND